MAELHVLFHRQEKMLRKGTRRDTNERHAHSLTCTVRHRSLHGPIKIDISVCGSVAVSVSGHMQSCIIYFYFLDFYRSSVRVRTNGIAPLALNLSLVLQSLLPAPLYITSP